MENEEGAFSNLTISGEILATRTPIAPRTQMRGITLFSRGKLVNRPEHFSESTSSHFFSYITGWLEVDFIDEISEDVIATDRQSLLWDHPDMADLRGQLQKLMSFLQKDWRERRRIIREEQLSKNTNINLPDWFSKLPPDIRPKITNLVGKVIEESELDTESSNEVVRDIRSLVPDYPYFHYRRLHPEIRSAAKRTYASGDYYDAFIHAMKRYIRVSRDKAKVHTSSERSDLEQIFQAKNPILNVVSTYKRADGSDFSERTRQNIIEAHKMLSVGVVAGARHPIVHEEVPDLQSSELFTEQDCLDALSLLSHLFRRLDSAVKVREVSASSSSPE